MIVNVHKTRRFGDHVLLVHPAFFNDTGPGDGKLTAGVVNLTEVVLLGSGKVGIRASKS